METIIFICIYIYIYLYIYMCRYLFLYSTCFFEWKLLWPLCLMPFSCKFFCKWLCTTHISFPIQFRLRQWHQLSLQLLGDQMTITTDMFQNWGAGRKPKPCTTFFNIEHLGTPLQSDTVARTRLLTCHLAPCEMQGMKTIFMQVALSSNDSVVKIGSPGIRWSTATSFAISSSLKSQ